jgi:hypothetical protein
MTRMKRIKNIRHGSDLPSSQPLAPAPLKLTHDQPLIALQALEHRRLLYVPLSNIAHDLVIPHWGLFGRSTDCPAGEPVGGELLDERCG